MKEIHFAVLKNRTDWVHLLSQQTEPRYKELHQKRSLELLDVMRVVLAKEQEQGVRT